MQYFGVMSTADFDKFDLEGLSLEDMEPVKKAESVEDKLEVIEPAKAPEIRVEEIEAKPVEAPQLIEEVKPAAPPPLAAHPTTENAEANYLSDGQMSCPKCELVQAKAEQCSGCGVYVKKAQAMGQSKIQITSTKF